jgi:hypothetical protein
MGSMGPNSSLGAMVRSGPLFCGCAGGSLDEAAVHRVYSTVEGYAMSMRGVALALAFGSDGRTLGRKRP